LQKRETVTPEARPQDGAFRLYLQKNSAGGISSHFVGIANFNHPACPAQGYLSSAPPPCGGGQQASYLSI
jgi:hypothetical protein